MEEKKKSCAEYRRYRGKVWELPLAKAKVDSLLSMVEERASFSTVNKKILAA